MATDPTNTDEGYFNDLSRQPRSGNSESFSPNDQSGVSPNCDGEEIPKTKRIACVICRKRKLKCDGNRPKCSTCARLGHNCAYDEVRRKSGPKRGYVKELEARLGTANRDSHNVSNANLSTPYSSSRGTGQGQRPEEVEVDVR